MMKKVINQYLKMFSDTEFVRIGCHVLLQPRYYWHELAKNSHSFLNFKTEKINNTRL